MLKYKPNVYLAMTIVAAVWFSTGNVFAQFSHKEPPLWEGMQKTSQDIQNDEQFVKKILELSGGDANVAAQQAVGSGWELLSKGDANGAIRRFNLATLLKTDMPEIYWGFAIGTHVRGDPLKDVERWFDEAEKKLPQNLELLADRGRVLHERKMPAKARPYFQKSLELNPSHLPSMIGLMLVSQELGDTETYEKFKAEVEKQTK